MVMETVKDEKELGKRLKSGQDEICIEGDLVNKVLKIKATGSVVWGAVILALGVVVAATIATIATGGVAAPVTSVALMATAPVACSTLGLPVALSAVAIAVAGGSIEILNQLREYEIEKISDTKLVLRRK